MTKTVDGISFSSSSVATAPVLTGSANPDCGLYFTSGGTTGFSYLGANVMTVDGAVTLQVPLVANTISGTNISLSSAGSTAAQSANYISASFQATSSSAAYFTYFDSPTVSGSFIPNASYTLYVADAPSSGASRYALYVNSGAVYFGAQLMLASSNNQLKLGIATISCALSSSATYTIPDAGGPASFILSTSISGQAIAASSVTGSTVKGGIAQFGVDGSSILNNTSANTVYFSYFSTQSLIGNSATTAATVCIAGAPSGATTARALYVAGGTSAFNGTVLVNTLGFNNDPTTGVTSPSAGTVQVNSGGSTVATFNSGGLTLPTGKNLSFSGGVILAAAGSSMFALSTDGLATIANGYPGTVSSTVTVAAPAAGSAFSTTPTTINAYFFPLGGKAYYAVLSTGTSTSLKTGGTPQSSNYLIIKFSGFTTITSAFLEGDVATYASTTNTAVRNISLHGYTLGTGVSSNAITLVFPINSSLIGSNLWTGTSQSLTAYFTGIIFADK